MLQLLTEGELRPRGYKPTPPNLLLVPAVSDTTEATVLFGPRGTDAEEAELGERLKGVVFTKETELDGG